MPVPTGIGPLGPIMNGPTVRISKVSPAGVRSTVVDGVPSSVTQFGGDEVGMVDVAIIDGRVYAILGGGGRPNVLADHPALPNGVIKQQRRRRPSLNEGRFDQSRY